MAGSVYYQVGGWQGNIEPPPGHGGYGFEKPLAEALFEDGSPLRPDSYYHRPRDPERGPVEMVLGIRRSGASSLLITSEEEKKYQQRYRTRIRGPPKQASDYVSLSPIVFETVDDLRKKLLTLSPKKGRGDRDMSQANVIYSDERASGKEPEGIARGEYELNRLFYRFAMGDWKRAKYSLAEDWRLPQGTRVCILTFSVYSKQFDTRSDSERLENPRILDVAFAQADPKTLNLRKDTLKSFVAQENSKLGNHTFRTVMEGEQPETLPLNEIGRRVSSFFNQGSGPTLLIVYDKTYTRSVLRKLGCVPPEGATMRDVFLPLSNPSQPRPGGRDRWSPYSNSTTNAYDHRGNRRRSRSRSPVRNSRDPRQRASVDSRRERRDHDTDAPARQFVYADVHEMYQKMSTMHCSFGTRPLDISGSLGVYKRKGLAEWGAGLEVGVIFDCWKAMASGPAIDEQRARLPSLSSGSSTPATLAPSTQVAATPAPGEEDEYDEDRDPNDDIAEVEAATARHQASLKMKAQMHDDYLSDDEDEY